MEAKKIIMRRDAAVNEPEGPLSSHAHLTVSKGKFVYLFGKSGTGKTSLLISDLGLTVNYSALSALGKWTVIGLMLLGRVAIFSPACWLRG